MLPAYGSPNISSPSGCAEGFGREVKAVGKSPREEFRQRASANHVYLRVPLKKISRLFCCLLPLFYTHNFAVTESKLVPPLTASMSSERNSSFPVSSM